MNTKIHQIPVRDVLALLNEGKTEYYICYNIAVLMISVFEREYYEQWQEYKDSYFDHMDPKYINNGFHAFSFCHHIIQKGMSFEISIFEHLEQWMLRYYNEESVNNLSYFNFIAKQKALSYRDLRISLLEKVLADNPDAMFNVKL